MNVTVAPSFVPNPPGRGTLGLLWECLFTYFLCLWTVGHTNVVDLPDQWLKLTSKFGWCCLIFFLPEWAVYLVVLECLRARDVRRRANKDIRADQDGERVLPTGLARYAEVPQAISSRAPQETGHEPFCPVTRKIVGPGSRWGLTHGHLVEMGGLKFKHDENEAEFPLPDGIQQLSKGNMLPTVSFLSAKIQALQKSDKLAKILVCLQPEVSWLIIQAIARRIAKLPVTLLELNTIAQVWITLVIYGLWWFKPQGIAEVIEVDFSHCNQCRKQLRENGTWPLFSSTRQTNTDAWPSSQISRKFSVSFLFGIISIAGTVYIAVDALGWTAYFPTHSEMIVWRVSICIFAGSSLLLLIAALLYYLALQLGVTQRGLFLQSLLVPLRCFQGPC
jgi:hypothetical protein